MKLDRLVSRIRAALEDYASEFEQRALAAEYAEACALAAQRLEQIVPLLRGGQDYPALQIAESPPPVLDLVRQLSFAEAEQWRAFCRQRGLPAPQPFDEQAVDLVNRLYGKKIGETHPLYRDYRQAIRLRDEDQALRVLQSIRRVNPDDANAHAEFARLARKIFERHSVELAAALDRGDEARVLALMETIEVEELPARAQSPIWQRAVLAREHQQIESARARCLVIAPRLRELHEAGQWREILPLLAEWETLREQFAVSLPAETEAIATAAREWAVSRLNNHEREEELLRQRQALTARLDELARAPANRPIAVLQSDLAELLGQAAIIESQAGGENGVRPPLELLRRLEQETDLLRKNLGRRRALRTVLAMAALGSVAAVVTFVVWSHVRRQNFDNTTARIQQLLQTGDMNALAAALKDFDANYPQAATDAKYADLLQSAHAGVSAHETARGLFDQQMAQITKAAADNPSPADIVALLSNMDSVDQLTAKLAPDETARAKTAAQQLRASLTDQLSKTQDQRAARLAGITARANKLLADKLTGDATAEITAATVKDAQAIVAEAAQWPIEPGLTSPAEQEARMQLDDLTKRLNTLAAAARDALAACTQLAESRQPEDYRAALEALAGNSLASDPTVSAARALTAIEPDWDGAAQHILMPGDVAIWAYLSKANEGRLQPAENDQGEATDFSRLVKLDHVLGDTYHAELVEYANGAVVSRAPLFLTEKPIPLITNTEAYKDTHQTGNVIKRDGSVAAQQTDLMQFMNGNVPGNVRGQNFENVQLAPESKLAARIIEAYNPRTEAIREPLLRVLDDVRADPQSSPVLKAYLEQEIFKIMQHRPLDWGLAFSPSAQADARALAKITGGSLLPTDWLYPPASAEDLRAFYERTAKNNYYAEASAALQKLLRLRATPMIFAGYVDLAQQPQLRQPAPAAATLWGLDAKGRWFAMFEIRNGQTARLADAPLPARLTPLVYANENASGPPTP